MESSRVREPRRPALPHACSRRVYGNGFSSLGHLWPVILLVPVFGPIPGSAGISVKMDSSVRFLRGWQDIL